MFARQPDEGSGGLSDAALVDIARQAGIDDPSAAECITAETYRGFVERHVAEEHLQQTPTILFDGREVTPAPGETLAQAIRAAVGGLG
jgi:predicted DsbA family dithiol-disulfide isomerase